MPTFYKPVVAAFGGDVATIRCSMTTFDGKIDEMHVAVRDKELLIAKNAYLEKQVKDLHVKIHSASGRHSAAIHKLNKAATAAAKAAADDAAAASKAATEAAAEAAERELTLVAEMHRLKDEKNRYFHTAYWLDVDCKSKVEFINAMYRELKSKDDIIYGMHRELKYNDTINAGLHREMATNNALEDLTNTLKPDTP